MARSKGKEEYWQGGGWRQQGYRSEPGVPITAKGAEEGAVLEADQTEAIINANDEEPETYACPSTFTGHHSPANRTTVAQYFPVSQALKISFPATSPASGGSYLYHSVSRDEFEAFKASPSPGRYINDVLSAHSYGRVG
jgi:hypothetical protein